MKENPQQARFADRRALMQAAAFGAKMHGAFESAVSEACAWAFDYGMATAPRRPWWRRLFS